MLTFEQENNQEVKIVKRRKNRKSILINASHFLSMLTLYIKLYICIEHIRQVEGKMVTFPDLTATLKSAGSFKKQGTEA